MYVSESDADSLIVKPPLPQVGGCGKAVSPFITTTCPGSIIRSVRTVWFPVIVTMYVPAAPSCALFMPGVEVRVRV